MVPSLRTGATAQAPTAATPPVGLCRWVSSPARSLAARQSVYTPSSHDAGPCESRKEQHSSRDDPVCEMTTNAIVRSRPID